MTEITDQSEQMNFERSFDHDLTFDELFERVKEDAGRIVSRRYRLDEIGIDFYEDVEDDDVEDGDPDPSKIYYRIKATRQERTESD